MVNDTKSCSHMETVFQQINKNFVSLPEQMKKDYNIYQTVIQTVINKMKETNPLFSSLYRELFYGGSYYDGLKISKPEEYDLDLLLKLPDCVKPELLASDLPGFVKVKLTNFENFQQEPRYKAYYSELPKILDEEQYLDADKVKKWMESIINKTLNKFEKSGDQSTFICEQLKSENKTFFIKLKKGGPAFTLQITNPDMTMDVDLVPCFVFEDKWPVHCNFKQNPCPADRKFFIVPKSPHNKPNDGHAARCWRMSFQIQERELIKGRESLKPALKLLKKLRDNLNHVCISSYFLKTIFLFEVKKRDDNFWLSNHSTTFIEMLKVYHSYLDKKEIPYFWNENYNMIGHLKGVLVENVANKINNIIKEIDRNFNDPFVVAKYLLNTQELMLLKEKIPDNKQVSEPLQSATPLVSSSNGSVTPAIRNTSSPSTGNQTIIEQLQGINEKLNKIMEMQLSLNSKIDGIEDRVKCIECRMGNRNNMMPVLDQVLQ